MGKYVLSHIMENTKDFHYICKDMMYNNKRKKRRRDKAMGLEHELDIIIFKMSKDGPWGSWGLVIH